jgi:hypothetical protein
MNYQQKIFGKLLEKRRKGMGLSKKELAIKLIRARKGTGSNPVVIVL